MSSVSLDATLTESPECASDSGFPSTSGTTIAFGLACDPKHVAVSAGRQVVSVLSPSAFVTIGGVGTGDTVTQASVLYVRVKSPGWQARVTFANPAAPMSPIVSIVPIAGVLLLEPDYASGYYVTKLELQGSGQAEVYASGPQ